MRVYQRFYRIVKVCDPMHIVVEETTETWQVRCYVESVNEVFKKTSKYREAWKAFVEGAQ